MDKQHFMAVVGSLSMTGELRIAALYDSLEHIRLNNVPGDLVECGVWRGGNILGMMTYCAHYNLRKTIWAYDTFTGMPAPTAVDVDLRDNHADSGNFGVGSCACSLAEVKRNLNLTALAENFVKFVVGDVNVTLQRNDNVPKKIALLRLDTDWYESTRTELNVLYPMLSANGVLIVDDYGHWRGCKQATDEYFKEQIAQFVRIDYTGLLLIKPSK